MHEELDSSDDTLCGGTNFWLHDLTGKIFSVSPFIASYDPMQDVQIATCLTAHTDEYGQNWILVFNDVLWFMTRMDHLLINPNHIRMAVIPVSDGTFDENQKLGISYERVFIPFGTDETTVYFDKIAKTQRKITECIQIIMTGHTEWDQKLVQIASVRSKEEEKSCKICDTAWDSKFANSKLTESWESLEMCYRSERLHNKLSLE